MTNELEKNILREAQTSEKKGFRPDKERNRLVMEWKNAPERVIDYDKGSAIDNDGNPYDYPSGHRLLIGDPAKGEVNQVMDTCETPWAFATVDKTFEGFPQNSGRIDMLDRGLGMGITLRRAIQNLITRGGSYTAMELNKEIADYGRKLINRTKIALANMANGLPGTKPDINISLIEGDSYEETAKLANEGRKFDIIISDTFPLNEEEKGINDLKDLNTLKKCLNPNGVFTFFAYFPGSTGGVVKKQENMITPHFREYSVCSVEVNPPPGYKYLQGEHGGIRRLAVVVCKNPII